MADVAWSHQLARNSPARMALWSLAALSMLAAHAVAGWWVLSAPSRLPEVTGPAPAP
jgi:hypothetical protein